MFNKKPKPDNPEPGQMNQRFALVVTKTIDGTTALVNVKSRCEGIALEEAVFYVEGWLDKTKEELKKKYFGSMEFSARGGDDNV